MRLLNPAVTVTLLLPAVVFGAVTVGSTEHFNGTGSAWGVGGDAFNGWQTAFINRDPNAVEPSRFFFSNTVQRNWGTSSGQPYPGSVSGVAGTLLVQHDCVWGNSTDPGTGQPYNPADIMIAYISFNSTAGVTYQLDAWVNSIRNVAEPPVPPGRDGIHPIAVDPALAGFPGISLGLKAGLFDPATDFTAPFTLVVPTGERTWEATPMVSAMGTGGPMTIILRVANPDTKAGANIITDTSWDDVRLVPEPASLMLLAAGLLWCGRRR